MIKKIISGGQTGADQAALDVALEQGIPHVGWIPKGRKTENGPLPEKYQLQEMPTASYPKRTEQNVIDSDGTMIITHGELSGGSALTQRIALKYGRPCIHLDMYVFYIPDAVKAIKSWISRHKIQVLNVAGSRDSKDPGIYATTKEVLEAALVDNEANDYGR